MQSKADVAAESGAKAKAEAEAGQELLALESTCQGDGSSGHECDHDAGRSDDDMAATPSENIASDAPAAPSTLRSTLTGLSNIDTSERTTDAQAAENWVLCDGDQDEEHGYQTWRLGLAGTQAGTQARTQAVAPLASEATTPVTTQPPESTSGGSGGRVDLQEGGGGPTDNPVDDHAVETNDYWFGSDQHQHVSIGSAHVSDGDASVDASAASLSRQMSGELANASCDAPNPDAEFGAVDGDAYDSDDSDDSDAFFEAQEEEGDDSDHEVAVLLLQQPQPTLPVDVDTAPEDALTQDAPTMSEQPESDSPGLTHPDSPLDSSMSKDEDDCDSMPAAPDGDDGASDEEPFHSTNAVETYWSPMGDQVLALIAATGSTAADDHADSQADAQLPLSPPHRAASVVGGVTNATCDPKRKRSDHERLMAMSESGQNASSGGVALVGVNSGSGVQSTTSTLALSVTVNDADETAKMEREIAEVEAAVIAAESQLSSWWELDGRLDAQRERIRSRVTHVDGENEDDRGTSRSSRKQRDLSRDLSAGHDSGSVSPQAGQTTHERRVRERDATFARGARVASSADEVSAISGRGGGGGGGGALAEPLAELLALEAELEAHLNLSHANRRHQSPGSGTRAAQIEFEFDRNAHQQTHQRIGAATRIQSGWRRVLAAATAERERTQLRLRELCLAAAAARQRVQEQAEQKRRSAQTARANAARCIQCLVRRAIARASCVELRLGAIHERALRFEVTGSCREEIPRKLRGTIASLSGPGVPPSGPAGCGRPTAAIHVVLRGCRVEGFVMRISNQASSRNSRT
jgi:hypothetical protein